MSERFSETWSSFRHEQRLTLAQALEAFLLDEGRYDCFVSLNYILAELAGNAEKSNLKRAHFEMLQLNPHNPEEYAQGMAEFKNAVARHSTALAEIGGHRGAHLKIRFEKDGANLVFTVYNNAPLLPVEASRYHEKVEAARRFQTIEEVMTAEQDLSEGGGLGLIITILMLRKIGLDESHLTLGTDDRGTTARLVVPPQAESGLEVLSQVAVEAIDHIPQFPDTVMRVLRILEDPSKSFEDVGPLVRQDANLVAELVRAANSSVYRLPRQVASIDEAVRVLGLPAIRDLLLAVTTERLLIHGLHQATVKTLVRQAVEVAWYCRELLRVAHQPQLSGSLFLGAMLHDLGEILVHSVAPQLTQRITAVCQTRGWNVFSAETLTAGLNHSLIGAALARKWQFPESIVEVIEYHHRPLEAGRATMPLACLVYLGDFLWSRARNLVPWDDLLPGVLEVFPRLSPADWRTALKDVLFKGQSELQSQRG